MVNPKGRDDASHCYPFTELLCVMGEKCETRQFSYVLQMAIKMNSHVSNYIHLLIISLGETS